LLVDNRLLVNNRLMGLLHVGNAIQQDAGASHGSGSRGNIPATAVMVMVTRRANHHHWLGVGGGDCNRAEADNSNSSAKGNGENSVAHGRYLKRHLFPKGGGCSGVSPRTAQAGSVLRISAQQSKTSHD
jgi:hypothetical protein